MKRYLVTSAVLATSMFAATNAQIVEYLRSQTNTPDLKIEVQKRDKLEGIKNYELVIVEVGKNGKTQTLKLFTTKGDLIFPDVINTKNKKSYLGEFEKKQMRVNLKKIYAQEDKANIITLGNDKKKETLVVFTDPECPYCRQELKEIKKRLEKNNLKLLLTPVHGRSSLEKSHIIYEEIKKAKDDKTKIDILKKYYANDVNISDKNVSDKDVKAMEDLRRKYLGNSIIKGVPYIVPEKEIK